MKPDDLVTEWVAAADVTEVLKEINCRVRVHELKTAKGRFALQEMTAGRRREEFAARRIVRTVNKRVHAALGSDSFHPTPAALHGSVQGLVDAGLPLSLARLLLAVYSSSAWNGRNEAEAVLLQEPFVLEEWRAAAEQYAYRPADTCLDATCPEHGEPDVPDVAPKPAAEADEPLESAVRTHEDVAATAASAVLEAAAAAYAGARDSLPSLATALEREEPIPDGVLAQLQNASDSMRAAVAAVASEAGSPLGAPTLSGLRDALEAHALAQGQAAERIRLAEEVRRLHGEEHAQLLERLADCVAEDDDALPAAAFLLEVVDGANAGSAPASAGQQLYDLLPEEFRLLAFAVLGGGVRRMPAPGAHVASSDADPDPDARAEPAAGDLAEAAAVGEVGEVGQLEAPGHVGGDGDGGATEPAAADTLSEGHADQRDGANAPFVAAASQIEPDARQPASGASNPQTGEVPPPKTAPADTEPVRTTPTRPESGSTLAPAPGVAGDTQRDASAANPGPASNAGGGLPEDADAILEALRGELCQSLARAEFGLAAWIGEACDLSPRAVRALKAAALVAATSDPMSALASRATAELAQVAEESGGGDGTWRVIAISAATRLALIAPHSGVTTTLRTLLKDSDLEPTTKTVLEAALKLAESGQPLIAPIRDREAEDPKRFEERAREVLEQGPQKNSIYQLAGAVWLAWLRSGGVIHQLLSPVSQGHVERAKEVGSLAFALRDRRQIEQLIDAEARRIRPYKPTKIEARARDLLVLRLEDARDVALAWSKSVSQRAPAEDEFFHALRSTVRDGLPRLHDGFRAMLGGAPEELAAAATSAGARLIGSVYDASEDRIGTDPDLELARPLFLAYEIPLEDFTPASPLNPGALLAVARGRAWPEGFRGRYRQGDFDIAELLLDDIRGADAFDEYSRELDDALDETKLELDRLHEQCRIELDTMVKQGLLDGARTLDARAVLERWPDPARRDLRRVRMALERLGVDLDARRREAVREAEVDLDDLTSAEGGDIERVRALLRQGEVATARAYADLVRRGIPLPARSDYPDPLEVFYPNVLNGLEHLELTRTVLADIKAKGRFGPVSWQALNDHQRDVAHKAVTAWLDVRDIGNLHQAIRGVLSAIGIEGVDNLSVEQGPRSRPQRHDWATFTGHSVGRVPVPQFGSELGGRFHVLVCWGRPAERDVLDWLQERPSAPAVVVLYFGVADMAFRRNLADLSRSSKQATRPAIIVDDAVFLYQTTQPRLGFDTVVRLGLPFARVNPYQPFRAGLVPREMFYGRQSEVADVLDPAGASVLYGGRQLGKSAILRAVQRQLADDPNSRVLFVDLAGHELDLANIEDFWQLLDHGLNALDIPVGRGSATRVLAERVVRRIQAWLEAHGERRLYLLIDEADRFVDVDAQLGGDHTFPNIWRLKRLRDDTGLRFKPVLVGLRHVMRFRAASNSPFAHVKHLGVGPLVPQEAFDLIDMPMRALGFRLDDTAVNRVLAYTHFNPGLIQLLCRELVDYLQKRPLRGAAVPTSVRPSDIDRVYTTAEVGQRLRDRFMTTLHLDHRYLVIVHTLAVDTDLSAGQGFLTASALLEDCQTFWPPGFADTNLDDFASLLAELVNLGLIRHQDGRYGLAGQHVRLMLGTPEEVLAVLDNTAELTPPSDITAAGIRGRLGDDPVERSPFTSRQLYMATRPGTLCLVVGSPALGVDRVRAALLAYGSSSRGGGSARVSVAEVDGVNDLIAAMGRGVAGADLYVPVLDVRDVGPDDVDAVVTAWRSAPHRSVSPVMIVRPSPSGAWRRALALQGRADNIDVVVLGRWSRSGLQRVFSEVVDPLTPQQQSTAMELTGGWPLPVEWLLRKAKDADIVTSLEEARRPWTAPEARAFIDALCIEVDPALSQVFDAVAQYEETVTTPEIAVLLDQPNAADFVELLLALGVLSTGADGRIVAEPVAAAAWKAAGRS